MSFLTSNFETLTEIQAEIEDAFDRRSLMLDGLSDTQMLQYDPAGAEAEYQAALDDMSRVAAGVELLKEGAEIARIYEWYMWAAWLRNRRRRHAVASYSEAPRLWGAPPSNIEPEISIGTDIEDRLRGVGVGRAAGVTLTGHWYSENTPADWTIRLAQWADGYRESIANR